MSHFFQQVNVCRGMFGPEMARNELRKQKPAK